MSERKVSRSNVESMFDHLAPNYDFLNHLFSAGVDIRWRKIVAKEVKSAPYHKVIADYAAGTGDMSIELARRVAPLRLYALDLSEGMLAVAREKAARKGFPEIVFRKENCQETKIKDGSIDVVTNVFGIRNFLDPQAGLADMYRVLRPQGRAVIMEFATPESGFVSAFVKFYYGKVMPFVSKILCGEGGSFTYLPLSIYDFPNGEAFCDMMRLSGFKNVRFKSLTFNMVNLYVGEK